VTPEAPVTHAELAELVQVVDRRMAAFERGLNRTLLVLGTSQAIILLILLLVLAKVGL
jgi:hypothetical protein